MTGYRQRHNAAFEHLLALANDRIDVLERALVECAREAGGNPPSFSAVEQRLKDYADGAVSMQRPQGSAEPPLRVPA